MALKKYKAMTNGLRHMTSLDYSELTTDTPEKSLLVKLNKKSGRNNQGKITVRHRGGGHKRRYRLIDFYRQKDGISARVDSIQYDPNRSARIALLNYSDGEKRYIIAPEGLAAGMDVISGEKTPPEVGNCMPLKNIPLSTVVHNVELYPGRGAVMCRSAGTSATLMAREGTWAQLSLPSGEIRRIPEPVGM